MYKIKKGDIVGRTSYGKDILFTVEKIVKQSRGKTVAILKGIILRIEADADMDDLVLMEKQQVEKSMRNLENKIEDKIKKCTKKYEDKFERRKLFKRSTEEVNGRILHLDGELLYENVP